MIVRGCQKVGNWYLRIFDHAKLAVCYCYAYAKVRTYSYFFGENLLIFNIVVQLKQVGNQSLPIIGRPIKDQENLQTSLVGEMFSMQLQKPPADQNLYHPVTTFCRLQKNFLQPLTTNCRTEGLRRCRKVGDRSLPLCDWGFRQFHVKSQYTFPPQLNKVSPNSFAILVKRI